MKLPPAILVLLSGLLVSATVPGCSNVLVPRSLAGASGQNWVIQPSWSRVHHGGASDGVFSRFIKKVLNFFGFSRSEIKPGTKTSSVTPFAATINGMIESSDGEAFRGGSYFKALLLAQQKGVPLLVVLAHNRGGKKADIEKDDLWAALTHSEFVDLCRDESVVAWGAWVGSQEAQAVGKKVPDLKRAATGGLEKGAPSGTVALLRPRQESSNAATSLASFPPRVSAKSKKKAPKTTGPKLVAWVTSSKRRYASELAKDASMAKDRAIMAEVSDGFKAGLAADQARERREAEEARAAAEAERVAQAKAAAVKAQVMAEKARRAAILERLGEEPPAPSKGSKSMQKISGGDAADPVALVAVRLSDGTRRRRRFYAAKTTVQDLIDWLDAAYEVNPTHLTLREAGMSKASEGFTCAGCGGGDLDVKQKAKTLKDLGFHTKQVLLNAETHEEEEAKDDEEADAKDESEGDD